MLEYLVTSRARRELLKLLWLERRQGSARQLAKEAGVSSALANRELKEMQAAGLATARVVGAARLFAANREHPQAENLEALLRSQGSPKQTWKRTRALLASLGAPLLVEELDDPNVAAELDLEEGLVSGMALARHDPSVARALPVLFARRLVDLHLERLEELARARDKRRLLGFFAELTAVLQDEEDSSTRTLHRLAKKLRDARDARPVPFFETAASRFDEQLMEERTPDVARRWHYRMNLPLEDFQAFFDKHAKA